MDPDTEGPIAISAVIALKLNFACHQSAFAVIRDLRIENHDADNRMDDVVLTVQSNPAFMREKSWRLDRIEAGGVVPIRDRNVELDGSFFLNLSDAMRGSITVRAKKDGEQLAEYTTTVDLLAYNEWGGSGYMPELLPAFCVPNDPAVDRVLGEAANVLRKAGKKDTIEGYKSGSRQRVWEIASAIYTAIANLDINYAVPPASFESDGQKIRLPSQILENRVATCLDITMLIASALEQAGLNPIVVLPKDHAMVGVWLQPEDLSAIVIDQAEMLRKRIQLKELILIETTYVTSNPAPPFSKAVSAGESAIVPEIDATFSAAVDIKRARAHRISPLGLKTSEVSPLGVEERVGFEQALEEAPSLPDFDTEIGEAEEADTPKGRLDRWQRRLLDLTARNPLLNHKSTKASLKIICPQPGQLEDKLAAGARIAIHAVPRASNEAQDEQIHRQRTGEVITDEYARYALEKKQVLVDLEPDELGRRAVEIYRKTQSALQEGGANTLYLALGFLLWKRDEKDERRFRAPLILMPVTLERKSVRSGIKIASHDDESRFNTTLLEMLRRDFAIDIRGLDGSLPADESGVDVGGIWNLVRKAVKEAPGFEVVEDVVLGHFSFAKFLMWKDLVDRTDQLKLNPVVEHLIETPRDPYPSEVDFVDKDTIDKIYKPSDIFCPLPADSSQLAAIATADRGKDFVIIGPPGTGKSQTISNMIAHLLSKGKTVLFVSEKTAALEVVYRRLEDVGLGRFCLELHSNKARKADVLNQLGRAWHSLDQDPEKAWESEAENLRQLRDQLNRVVDHLHMEHRNGMTPHYAMGIKIRDEALAGRVSFSWPSAEQHDEATLNAMREAAEMLAIQAQAIGEIAENPFQLIAHGDWTPHWEAEVVTKAGRLSVAASAVDRACKELCEVLGIELSDRQIERLDTLAELAQVLLDSYRNDVAFALEQDGSDRLEALEEAANRLEAYAAAQSELSVSYAPMAWRKIDGDDVARRWQQAQASWWGKRHIRRKAIIKELQQAGAFEEPSPYKDAPILKRLRQEGEALDRLSESLKKFKDWKEHATDPRALNTIQSLGRRARIAVGKLAEDAQSLIDMNGKLRRLLYDGNDLLAPEAAVGRNANAFIGALRKFQDEAESFEAIAGKSIRESFINSKHAFDTIRETADTIASRHSELRAWCNWRSRRNEAIDLDLKPLVDAIEQGPVSADEIQDTFEAAYCTWWSSAIIGQDEVLRTFSTPEHTAKIHKFRELDDKFLSLTAEYIEAKLSGRLPNRENIARGPQWGILNRELQKKTKHKPVRTLVQDIPEVLTNLTPCLMMSPLSVAQYLPADQALFDVVIFDEASQITVWDAVGSIARGRQVVVAGDPKQMPPTNFFARSEDDPDGDVDTEGDLESILDEMLGASIPERILNLHYRSRRESLIAFSNARYYDNTLITFPPPAVIDHGVKLVRPEGFYARGAARHNQGEARRIVSEILRRLTHPDATIQKMSIGVVTFNSEQQTLILNLLDDMRSRRPEIEWAFSSDSVQEPVFVKNLETVQGDERDVILFSVTYGPDQSGHVSMNFGPLNKQGGERRLNVALTRARSEMIVFSTLPPERIDLSRSQAKAVTDLKHFLEYAEKGASVFGRFVYGSVGDLESPFEVAVARALRDMGWNIQAQIGVSKFRIDLGVLHPDDPGVYLAGIECDGAMYHSSAVARERDKIRQAVLEDLNWRLFRIWSTDWWTNKAKASKGVHDKLLKALNQDREKTASDQETEQLETENAYADRRLNFLPEDETSEIDYPPEDLTRAPATQISEPDPGSTMPSSVDVGGHSEINPHQDTTSDQGVNYVTASFDAPGLAANAAEFYDFTYDKRLQKMIDHVIETEGPVHEAVLVRRIARHHGFQRAGRQIRERILKLAKRRADTNGRDYGPA